MKKTDVLKIRITPEQKEQLKLAAKNQNKTMSEIIRSKISDLR